MKGRSLQPTASYRYYALLKWKWKEYNRTAHLEGKIKLSFEHWCRNNNIDLTGRKKVYNPFLK